MEGLLEYADFAADTVKEAVTESAKTVKEEIQAGAPIPDREIQKEKLEDRRRRRRAAAVWLLQCIPKTATRLPIFWNTAMPSVGGGRVSAIPPYCSGRGKGRGGAVGTD